MRLCLLAGCSIAVALLPADARAQSRYDLAAPIPPTSRTEILVLGTDHLGALGDAFDPTLTASLVDVLVSFGPEMIAIEALPGVEVDRLSEQARQDTLGPARQLLDAFASETVQFGQQLQRELGIGFAGASAVADSLIHVDPMTPETRCSLIRHKVASYEMATAILQWSRYLVETRGTATCADSALAGYFEARLGSSNEIYSIAVPLALRLGMKRLVGVDDHIDDELGLATGYYQTFGPALQATPAVEELMASDYMRDGQRRLGVAAASGDLLDLYIRLNTSDYLNEDVASQWHLFFRTGLESGHDRARAALWEARNLNIAARLRAAAAFHPGSRILLIIGVGHKAFLDRYLDQMMDVKIVDFESIIGG